MSGTAANEGGRATRRSLMGGIVGVGLGAPLVAACGSSGSSGGSGGSGSSGGAPVGGNIAKTSEVPVGSGKIFAAQQVVLTQPTAGEFKAFSAVCPHQGCIVAEVTGADIDCACHGSRFSIKDGSVVNGPATRPLQPLTATVKGNEISVSG